METIENIHIGKLIEEQMKLKKYSTAKLAEELSCKRQNVYDIFHRKSIDTDLLVKISQLIDYDFIDIVYGPLMPNRTIHVELDFDIDGDKCKVTSRQR